MKLAEAISRFDEMRENQIEDDVKRRWLSDLDHQIFIEMIATHELPEYMKENETVQWLLEHEGSITLYEECTDGEAVLLVPEPYADVYFWWLASKTDLIEMNSKQYKIDQELYNNAYLTFQDYYNRTYLPIQRIHGFLCGSKY